MESVSSSARWVRDAVTASLLSALSASGVWLLWRVFVRTTNGQRFDDLSYVGARIGAWRVEQHAFSLLDGISVTTVALAMVGVFIMGAMRRRWLLAFEAVVIIAGANLSTQLLKHSIFTRPRLLSTANSLSINTLPSGHTTAAASAAVALVLVAPRWLRGTMALIGSIAMVAFGYATLVGQWHRPSDVLAGYLVCFAWGFATLAVTGVKRAIFGTSRHELDARPAGMPWLAFTLGFVGLGSLALSAGIEAKSWGLKADLVSRGTQFIAYAGASVGFVGVAAIGMAIFMSFVARSDSPHTPDAR